MKRLFALLLLLVLWATLLLGQQGMGPGPGVKSYAGGGPSDFVTETFTEAGAGEVELSLHTGELGATWTDHPHANYSGLTKIPASSDRLFGEGTAGYYTSGTPPSADYYVQADFCVATAITQSAGITGRMDTTADTMYLARLVDGATWQLRRGVTGTFTTLTGGASLTTTNIPSAGGACVTVKMVMTGDQITLIAGGTTVIGPVTDGSPITAAGRAGVRFNGTNGTASTGTHLDNFSAR